MPTIRLGDGIVGMSQIEAGSVSLVLSDLPSGETRADFDQSPNLDHLWTAIWHCLKPNGVAVLMASSLRFASKLYNSQQKTFRHDLVWKKSIATGFLNARRAPLRSHEFVLVFSRVVGTYHPQMITGQTPIHDCRRTNHGENYGRMTQSTRSRAGATDRYPTSVLEFNSIGTTCKTRVHPQQKPTPLLRSLILTYSNPGELVVDPFAGSGSTGVAAESEGREFVGWDLSPRFGRD